MLSALCGEWRSGQSVARAAFELGDRPWQPSLGARARRALRELESGGRVERREASGGLDAQRDEWRLVERVKYW